MSKKYHHFKIKNSIWLFEIWDIYRIDYLKMRLFEDSVFRRFDHPKIQLSGDLIVKKWLFKHSSIQSKILARTFEKRKNVHQTQDRLKFPKTSFMPRVLPVSYEFIQNLMILETMPNRTILGFCLRRVSFCLFRESVLSSLVKGAHVTRGTPGPWTYIIDAEERFLFPPFLR